MNKNSKRQALTVVDLKTVFGGTDQDAGKDPRRPTPICTGVPLSTKIIYKSTDE